MPQAPPCPDPRDLLRLTLGHVPEPEAEALGQHLLTCPHCAATLNRLHAKDTLIDALRGSRDTQLPDLPAVEALMDRLARTPPPSPLPDTLGDASADEALPGQIGRYQILGRLGAGGMGTVYRAHDAQLRRDVAIKVPRFDGPKAAVAAARQRFLREARAAAAVRNAHICPICDIGEQDGRPHVVMALVEGCSLAERLKEGPFADCREAVELVGQVAEALAAVHAAGIVHRDLKPGNILLDKSGQALLTDFGLARAERDSEHLTAEGALLGTPAYMAPEQVELEQGSVGPWSDQYSLAVVLYQMLTGRLPFEGSITSLLRQIATKTPPPPSQYRPGLDADLECVLLTAMARRPQDRYPTVTHFQRALLAWREKQAVTTQQTQAWVTTPNWKRPWAWLAAAIGVGLLAGGSYLLLKPSFKPDLPPTSSADVTKAPVVALAAKLDVRVWKKRDEPGLALGDAGALPLRAGDWMRIEARTDRPAYLYLIYLDTRGEASPMFPWRAYRWDDRPAEQQRRLLNLPEDPTKAAPLEAGPSGIEAVLLLAREERLSAAEVEQLKSLFKDAPPQGMFDPLRAAVWLGEEERFGDEADRGRPDLDRTGTLVDPVDRMRRLMRGDLKVLGGQVRVVCYPFQGK